MYEDLVTGFRARQCLDQELHFKGINADVHLTLWKLDLLNIPELYNQAVLAAAVAEVVIISLHGDRILEPATENWLTAWINQRDEKECALGILFDEDKREMDSIKDALFRLQLATRQSPVELFIGFEPLIIAAEGAHRRQSPETIIFAGENIREESTNGYRHWGLNE